MNFDDALIEGLLMKELIFVRNKGAVTGQEQPR